MIMARTSTNLLLPVVLVVVGLLGMVFSAPAVMECTPWSAEGLCTKTGNDSFKLACSEGQVGAIRSNYWYIHGSFSVNMRLEPGYTGGTCSAFYLFTETTSSNEAEDHFEIDVEIYGNENSSAVVLATNVFFAGKQNLAQFDLPFDAAEYHNYTMVWNQKNITWLVDSHPIRILVQSDDEPWPNIPLRPRMSQWSTSWSSLKPDFSKGPIPIYVENFRFVGCGSQSPVESTFGECPWWSGTEHEWNQPVVGEDKLTLTSFGSLVDNTTLLNEWGWDEA